MIEKHYLDILMKSRKWGWVLEPDAKLIMKLAGLDTPRFLCAATEKEACDFARDIGYPVVAKIVSPGVMHKSEAHGVEVGIDTDKKLTAVFDRFARIEDFRGMLVEEMISGIELIIGAVVDYQFGPMILLGMGGTGVEIYRDTCLRMAPLVESDVSAMIRSLKGRRLLEGYRGAPSVHVGELTRQLISFSNLIMKLETIIDSVDLNPVLCTSDRSIVADARIVLKKDSGTL